MMIRLTLNNGFEFEVDFIIESYNNFHNVFELNINSTIGDDKISEVWSNITSENLGKITVKRGNGTVDTFTGFSEIISQSKNINTSNNLLNVIARKLV